MRREAIVDLLHNVDNIVLSIESDLPLPERFLLRIFGLEYIVQLFQLFLSSASPLNMPQG